MEIQCAPPTTNATERLNEEFCCTIKPQTVFPCAETAPMLLWALLASGQTQMHEVGWLGNVLPSNPVQVMIFDYSSYHTLIRYAIIEFLLHSRPN